MLRPHKIRALSRYLLDHEGRNLVLPAAAAATTFTGSTNRANSGAHHRPRYGLHFSAAAAAVAAASLGTLFAGGAAVQAEGNIGDAGSPPPKPKLSLMQAKELFVNLEAFRTEIAQSLGFQPPKIMLSATKPSPTSAGDSPTVYSAELVVPPASLESALLVLTRALPSDLKLHNFNVSPFGGVRFSLRAEAGDASAIVDAPRVTTAPSITFFRDDGFYAEDIRALEGAYRQAWSEAARAAALGGSGGGGAGGLQLPPREGRRQLPIAGGEEAAAEQRRSQAAVEKLRGLGVEVFDKQSVSEQLDWDSLAGYDGVKREIEDTLVQALRHPVQYDDVARATRARFETNRPRAILLSGPPGTGKTLTARIIAQRSDKPMVHIAVESIVSKWYGESEKNLGQVFDACEELGGAIIFLDEIDAIATSRDSGNMHEVTRRILSVILRKIEGFEGRTKSTVIAATNRKSDLDAALLSRFDLSILFDLPDLNARAAILALYAKQLSETERRRLAAIADGMSCRDLKEACEVAERRWASRLIRKEVQQPAPDAAAYEASLSQRLAAAGAGAGRRMHSEGMAQGWV